MIQLRFAVASRRDFRIRLSTLRRHRDSGGWRIPTWNCLRAVGFVLALASVFCAIMPEMNADAEPKSNLSIGTVSFHYGHLSIKDLGKPDATADLSQGIEMASDEYEMTADTAHVVTSPNGGLPRVVARGNAAKQVLVVFKSMSQGMRVRFLSDQAVLDRDPDRLGGSKITFTGNVTMFVAAPAALEEESKTTLAGAVVLLGKGAGYPRLEADGINGTAMPAPAH
jgi:hypothetical protein